MLRRRRYEMFKHGLRELGYTEDHEVSILQRDAGDPPSRLPALAADLVRAGADVIFARGPVAVAAAAKASKTIAIVALDLESDPIALGYAKTLARPGGNVTGVFLDLPELSAKQLQLFREIVPNCLAWPSSGTRQGTRRSCGRLNGRRQASGLGSRPSRDVPLRSLMPR